MKMRFLISLLLIFVLYSCVNAEKVQSIQKDTETTKQPLTVSILGPDGKTMTLSDGREFAIYPDDQNRAAGWLDSDLEVKTNNSSDYPYTIYNKVTNDSIRAKLITHP